MISNKEYAQLMRDIAKADINGILQVSTALWKDIADVIENSVDVVKCKDCRWYDIEYGVCNLHSVEPDTYGTGAVVEMAFEDFCSYGERRSEDENQSNTNQK